VYNLRTCSEIKVNPIHDTISIKSEATKTVTAAGVAATQGGNFDKIVSNIIALRLGLFIFFS
jgi:co-chaperonin GroES (HSP10)